jgi:PCI domain
MHALPSCFSEVVELVNSRRLLVGDDVAGVEATLAVHQQALHANKLSTFRNAIAEYNLSVIGAAGGSVLMSDLQGVLGLDIAGVEEFIVTLVTKGKLHARISHRQASVIFEKPKQFSGIQIQQFCEKVARLADKVSAM